MAKKKAKKAAPKKAKAKTVKKAVKKTKTKTKRKSALTQLNYTLSDELAEIVGSKKATRPMVVKKLWAYIKAHKCQDAKNRRMIVPDKKLEAVLGKKPIDMLKMSTALNKHISK